jgi:hypothetical protein
MRAKTTSFTFAVCDGSQTQHMHIIVILTVLGFSKLFIGMYEAIHLEIMPLVKYKQCIVIHVLNL